MPYDKVKEKEYCDANREKINQNKKKYRDANKEKIKEYRDANKEKQKNKKDKDNNIIIMSFFF